MKKQLCKTAGASLLMFLLFGGCKKENNNKAVTTPFFENTVWTGEFTSAKGLKQPVSIEFKDGGRVSWHDIAGEALGSWNVQNNQVDVSIARGGGFKAAVSNDNKLTGIRNLNDSMWVLAGAALDTTAEPSLEWTTWTWPNGVIHFLAEGIADIQIGASYYTVYYEHKARSVRFSLHSGSWQWFIINNNTSVLKGVNQFVGDTIYPLEIVKQ